MQELFAAIDAGKYDPVIITFAVVAVIFLTLLRREIRRTP